MSKRSFRTALIIVIGSLTILACVIAYFVNRALSYPDECPDGTREIGKPGQMCTSDKEQDIEVEITSGMSFPVIAARLADKTLIERPTWFR
jgi:hypothetical protein